MFDMMFDMKKQNGRTLESPQNHRRTTLGPPKDHYKTTELNQ